MSTCISSQRTSASGTDSTWPNAVEETALALVRSDSGCQNEVLHRLPILPDLRRSVNLPMRVGGLKLEGWPEAHMHTHALWSVYSFFRMSGCLIPIRQTLSYSQTMFELAREVR